MKQNRLMKWIIGLLTMLPFLAIAVTCAYVTFNKNAKDSYSGYEEQIQYNPASWNDLEIGKKYVFKTDDYFTFSSAPTNTQRIDLQVSEYTYNNNNSASGTLSFLYYSSQQSIRVQFTNNDNVNVSVYSNTTLFNNSFILENVINLGNFYTNLTDFIYEYDILSTSHLDNAFYYAIDQFNDMGFDKIDFVSWFDVFNTAPSVYTRFINCYANYMLFVACITFLPRILYWFINFAFRVLDRFSNYGGKW